MAVMQVHHGQRSLPVQFHLIHNHCFMGRNWPNVGLDSTANACYADANGKETGT